MLFKLYICLQIDITMSNKNLNRLKVVLAEKGLSNKWLSEQLGITQATVSKWVTNTSQPNLDMLIKLSKVLDVAIQDLVRFKHMTKF